MNLTSAVKGLKVKGDEEHIRKHRSSVSLNAVVKYTLKSSLTALKPPYKALYGAELDPDSIIHSDGWRGYNGLVDLGYKKHYRVNHGVDQFVDRKSHINGIESFWAFAKSRLTKFHGIADSTFYLHLKECEFRFNYRKQNLYKLLLKMFRENPLF